jgi:hypothetical protein
LAKKAIREPEHRFGDLFNLMYNSKWVKASLKLVLSNIGSRTAGSDGITKEHLKDEKTREALIRSIVYEMKNDLYKPEPAKRVYIDKSSGGKRPLGIPTLKDRVVQQTLKLIIEPIFESDRWNFGVKIEASYVTDEETLWLAKLADKGSKVYIDKKKLNPFVTYQYEVERDYSDMMDKWEGRNSNPYTTDEYWKGKKLALKRDKYKCRLCGKKVTVGVDNHCHHIDGNISNHRLDNLVTLCIECHYETYGKESELTF